MFYSDSIRIMLNLRRHKLFLVTLFSVSEAAVVFDHPPPGGLNLTFPENKAPGTSLYNLVATDEDGNQPSFTINNRSLCELPTVDYSIPNFTINTYDQLEVPLQGLDAETCTQYKLIFDVTAGTNKVTSAPLTLRVTDINDKPPRFINLPYTGEVWKSQEDGQTVVEAGVIIAKDDDVSNLTVTLSISGAQTTFGIHPNGSVYVNDLSGLAALASPTVLTIQATDGGLTSTAPLTIVVHDDPCSSAPCQNGGTCKPKRTQFDCECLPGYHDTRCEKVDYCYIQPCQNEASCTSLDSTYSCNCTCPFASDKPENKNCTEYSMSPCLNNGTCKNGTTDDCICPPNYTGDRCEILDYCEASPCDNEGTCINGTTGYSCACPDRFTGLNCETLRTTSSTITSSPITPSTIRTTSSTTTSSPVTPSTIRTTSSTTTSRPITPPTNDWVIIGSVLPSVCVCCIVVLSVAFAKCNKKKQNDQLVDEKRDDLEMNPP